MGDLNEAFHHHDDQEPRSFTTRGNQLLNWFRLNSLRFPQQQLEMPSYHPYKCGAHNNFKQASPR